MDEFSKNKLNLNTYEVKQWGIVCKMIYFTKNIKVKNPNCRAMFILKETMKIINR